MLAEDFGNLTLTLRHNSMKITLRIAVPLKLTFPFYAPINVKPQGGGGGGGADPGKFDILIEANSKFPIPGHLQTVKFPTPGYLLIITFLPWSNFFFIRFTFNS